MKINIGIKATAAASGSTIYPWAKEMGSIIHKVRKDVDFGLGGMGSEEGYELPLKDCTKIINLFQEKGYHVERTRGKGEAFEARVFSDKGDRSKGFAIFGLDPTSAIMVWFDEKQSSLSASVATAAAKKPSDKSVKKAAAVLKQAKQAKADSIKEKLQAVIDKAMGFQQDHEQTRDLCNAVKAKRQAEIDRLDTKVERSAAKAKDRISKLVPRITKLQDEYHLVGGKDIVPQVLAGYFTSAEPSKKPKSGPLGKGVKDLKGDGKKTGKVIKKMTGDKKPKKRPQA